MVTVIHFSRQFGHWLAYIQILLSIPIVLGSTAPHPTGVGWSYNSANARLHAAYGMGLYHNSVEFGDTTEYWLAGLYAPEPDRQTGFFLDGRTAIDRSCVPTIMGFSAYRYSRAIDGYTSVSRGLMVPTWFAVALLGAPGFYLAIQSLKKQIRRKSIDSGLCPKCGYDIRATPTRCPECGTALTTKA